MQSKPAPDREIDRDDIDDVIGEAEELRRADEGKIGLAELRGVAEELELDPKYVDRAVDQLSEKRKAAAEQRRLEAERRARLARGGAMAAGAAAVLTLVLGLSTRSALSDAHADVAKRKAQVVNVLERKTATEKRLAGAPESSDKHAELSGSENRVRIERKRYDEAAVHYNQTAEGAFDSLVARALGFPQRVPLSAEIEEFGP